MSPRNAIDFEAIIGKENQEREGIQRLDRRAISI